MKSEEKQVIEYLKKEYGAEAIMFVGSRAVGDFKENSDWDIWVFTDKKNLKSSDKTKSNYGLENEELDLYFAPIKQKFEWDVFKNKLRFNKVIYDPKGIARRILKQANKVYSKGPGKWTKQFALYRIIKVKRYENKFKDLLKNKDYFQLNQRLAYHFLENSYVWWYGVRGEWIPRPQQMFPDLKKRDLKFYNYLKKIVSNKTSQKKRVRLFRKLHRYYFDSKAYRKVGGKDVDKCLEKLK